MKLTFTPTPGSPCRVIAADDEQPEGSWAEWAKPSPTASGTTAAALSPPACETPSAFPDPLPPLSCPHCPDRPLFFQARQQTGYYRSRFEAARKREADLKARIAELEAENRILKQRLFGSKSESRE